MIACTLSHGSSCGGVLNSRNAVLSPSKLDIGRDQSIRTLIRFTLRRIYLAASALSIFLSAAPPAHAYSQFTHLELIDVLWAESIRPLLLERYPGTDERALTTAHAYAYGGCLIQDIGYYPFGKTFFSDLAHHVRSGDFVVFLFQNSHDVNELAFSVGALSHYVGDSIGHSEATNRAVAENFPKLEAKFGPVVTFDDDPVAHVRTEFGFDVTQYAWERYASRAYRKHIGFRVARPLLYLAFRETYGLHAGGILGPARSALASYRWSVRTLLPAFLHAESILLRRRLPTENQGPIRGQFLAALSRADHARYWNASYEGPGVGAHFMAILIRIIPKFGKLKILAVKPPDTSTEDLYLGSMNDAIGRFREYLSRLSQDPNAVLQLTNLDLDTGAVVSPGASETADATYAELLFSLAHEPSPAPDGIRRDVLAYYADLSSPIHTRNDPKKWRKLLIDLEALRRSGG